MPRFQRGDWVKNIESGAVYRIHRVHRGGGQERTWYEVGQVDMGRHTLTGAVVGCQLVASSEEEYLFTVLERERANHA